MTRLQDCPQGNRYLTSLNWSEYTHIITRRVWSLIRVYELRTFLQGGDIIMSKVVFICT